MKKTIFGQKVVELNDVIYRKLMVIHCKMFNDQKTLQKENYELFMNNNTETRKNKHLNERERYAIELYLKDKYTV